VIIASEFGAGILIFLESLLSLPEYIHKTSGYRLPVFWTGKNYIPYLKKVHLLDEEGRERFTCREKFIFGRDAWM